MRRIEAQSYLESVAWTDPGHVRRFLNATERLLGGWPAESLQQFHQSLRRDGYHVDERTGQVTATAAQLSIGSVAQLRDPSAIQEGLERIRRAVSDTVR